ncbi:MAG: hypothetical protein WD803_00850 [Gammaproteobacteria bacterium]
MHVALSWDIKAVSPRWTEINDDMKEQLNGYSWVRPLSTYYVVNVQSAQDRDELVDKLVGVAKRHTETIYFVVTPVMTGGGYNGWLPKDLWDKINQRTK